MTSNRARRLWLGLLLAVGVTVLCAWLIVRAAFLPVGAALRDLAHVRSGAIQAPKGSSVLLNGDTVAIVTHIVGFQFDSAPNDSLMVYIGAPVDTSHLAIDVESKIAIITSIVDWRTPVEIRLEDARIWRDSVGAKPSATLFLAKPGWDGRTVKLFLQTHAAS